LETEHELHLIIIVKQLEPVSITEKALKAIEEIMKSKEVPVGYGLRIGLENMGASCGSTSYILGFDAKKSTDLVYEVDKIPVYINKKEVLHVTGLKLDHVTEGEVSGFSFIKED